MLTVSRHSQIQAGRKAAWYSCVHEDVEHYQRYYQSAIGYICIRLSGGDNSLRINVLIADMRVTSLAFIDGLSPSYNCAFWTLPKPELAVCADRVDHPTAALAMRMWWTRPLTCLHRRTPSPRLVHYSAVQIMSCTDLTLCQEPVLAQYRHCVGEQQRQIEHLPKVAKYHGEDEDDEMEQSTARRF